MSKRTQRSNLTASFIAAGVFTVAVFAATAHAEVLINQSKAQAGLGNGDAAGFPITITQPGSYRLTGNLLVPVGTPGIQIAAPGVVLDLGGHEINGQLPCSTSTICVKPDGVPYAHGIAADNTSADATAPTIRNGTVTRFPGNGIYLSLSGGTVENMNLLANGLDGITVNNSTGRASATLRHIRVMANRRDGCSLENALLDNSSCDFNGRYGILASNARVQNSFARKNNYAGLQASGIVISGGSQYQDNVLGQIGNIGNVKSLGGNLNGLTLF